MGKFDRAKQQAEAAARREKPKAPTTEIGVPAPVTNISGTPFGANLPWSQYVDQREYAPDLKWQGGHAGSIPIFDKMQNGDAQLAGLLMAATLPVRRLLWEIDPDGAPPERAEHVADSHGLPVTGQEPTESSTGFNHDRHLAHALRALGYGHFYFEEVYEYRSAQEGGDGLMHLAKLATRPPRTILNFIIGPHGELLGIAQNVGMAPGSPGLEVFGGRQIDANRLLPYVWNSEDDGDWVGRSMLRPVYRNWLLKDRLIRVDATKHERNGMGVPWFETDPKATKPQIDRMAEMAQEIRTGTRGGGAGPGKLRMVGVEGSIPDTILSIRYHDQQMASAFLAMFVELGKGETGSYSLGQALVDFHQQTIDTIADWYATTTQAQIDEECQINWDDDLPSPKIRWTRQETAAMSLEDLKIAIETGLIEVTDELRAQFVERWKLAGQSKEEIEAKKAEEPEPPPAPPATPPAPAPPAAPPAARQPQRSALADQIVTALTGPMTWPALARSLDRDPKNGTARRARDQLLAEGAILKRASDGKLAPFAELNLPERELRRNPNAFEVEAAVDLAAMETTFLSARESLIEAVKSMQGAQIDELRASVEAAAGDAAALAGLSVSPVDVDVIAEHLQAVRASGEASARGEHESQVGKPAASMAAPDTGAAEARVEDEAAGVAGTLAGGLAAAASKRASALRALPPPEAAEKVGEYLDGLSDAALTEQLGGATMHSFGIGRLAVMQANKPQSVVASEILDENTCTECSAVDGTEYGSVSASEADYPSGGGYVDCEGGLRCRGFSVAIY